VRPRRSRPWSPGPSTSPLGMTMRPVARASAVVFSTLLLALPWLGCAGIGVASTSDPMQKLRDAEVLFGSKGRPLLAERLIREAMAIYEQQHDDLGLAHTYRTYGFFFRSRSVNEQWREYYQKNGFLESSVTWDTRFTGSIRFFQKAVEIFDRMGEFDASTNVNLNMGFTYFLIHDTAQGCRALDKALDSYNANLRAHPDAKPQAPAGYGSFEEFVKQLRVRESCPSGNGHA
jgi:hypothetical protein